MQKKIIALAVAGLVSGAAFAESNVVISGIVDVGYQYSSDALAHGRDSQNAINDGGQDDTRIKFDGTEDLGNGLKVGFHLEQRLKTDIHGNVGTDNQNLFVSGAWGTVTAGSFGTALDDINGYSEVGGMGWGNGVIDMFRSAGWHANAVKYNSPNFNGLDFMVAYSTNNQNRQENDVDDNNVRAYSGRVSYVNGPVKAGLALIQERAQTLNLKRGEWLLSGSYNFGPVILGAGYAKTRFTGSDVPVGAEDKRTTYRINVGAPIGANDAVALSYSHTKSQWHEVDGSETAKGWGLSYSHNLSKRTNLYASYGQVNQDEDHALWTVNDNTYQKAFKVGLRHQF